MSDTVLSDDVAAVAAVAAAEQPAPIPAMSEAADRRGFPIVGPTVGNALRFFASLVDAHRVFEFGSGFGYSGAWFARALPPDGELILTDYDADNMAAAREYLAEVDDPPAVRCEAGDAMEAVERYDGPFEVVLIDHDKAQYAAALDRVRPEVADGGLVIADNVLAGPVTPAGVRATLDGEAAPDGATRGVVDYLDRVRELADGTVILPLGEGIAVSRLARQ